MAVLGESANSEARPGIFPVALTVFFTSFLVFVYTAPYTIYFGDSAELITAAKVLGVAHPPGYPLYVILGKIFSFFPFGTVAFRIVLLSIASASLSLVFLTAVVSRVLLRLRDRLSVSVTERLLHWVAAAGALVLGFSDIFWSQAIYAKTYSLNFFFVTLILWLTLRWWETGNKKFLLWVSFVYGLALTNHQLLLLYFPFFVISVMLGSRRLGARTLLGGGGLVLLGLSLYLFEPVRSAMHPAWNWGETHRSVSAFWDHLTRAQYGEFSLQVDFGQKLLFLKSFLFDVASQFGALVVFAVVGIAILAFREWRWFFVTTGVFISSSVAVIFLRGFNFNPASGYAYSFYFLPAYGIVSLWIGIGVFGVFALAQKKFSSVARFDWTLPLLLFAMAGVLLAYNFSRNDLHSFRFLSDYSETALESMDANAVLLVNVEGPAKDSVYFSLMYQQIVAGIRRDVLIVPYSYIFERLSPHELGDIYEKNDLIAQRRQMVDWALSRQELAGRPIYTTFLSDNVDAEMPWLSFSNGLVYRLVAGGSGSLTFHGSLVTVSEKDILVMREDFFGFDVLSKYYFAQAAFAIDRGDVGLSQDYFIRAIQADASLAGVDNASYRAHRDQSIRLKEN